jgi:MFS family permease
VTGIGRAHVGLYVATFLLQLGQGVVIPLLPSIVDRASASDGATAVGIAVAAFGLARLVASVPAGHLAGRVSPTWLIAAGPALMAVSLFGVATADSVPIVVAWRLLAGVSSALFVTASLIYLGDAAPSGRRGTAYAYFYTAFSAGISAGPAIGGVLGEAQGVAVPLLVVAGTSLMSAALVLLVLPRTRPSRPDANEPPAGAWAPWRDHRFLFVGLASLLVYATRNGTQQTVVPTAALDAGLPLTTIGIGFSLAAVLTTVGGPLAGYLLDRFGRMRLLVIGIGVLAVTILGWTLDGWLAGSFLVTMAAYGLVSALVDSATVTSASEIAPDQSRARAIGYYRALSDGGYVLGPVLFATLADRTSSDFAIVVNAALLAAVPAVGVAAARASGRRARP